MRLGPLPQRLELWRRRPLPSRELLPMLHQHFGERRSVTGSEVRIGAAFEQIQRIPVAMAIIKPRTRTAEQQGKAGAIP